MGKVIIFGATIAVCLGALTYLVILYKVSNRKKKGR